MNLGIIQLEQVSPHFSARATKESQIESWDSQLLTECMRKKTN